MEDFEKDIKDFFQRRKIKPSANAWQRMENLLNDDKPVKEKPVKLYYLLSAAASVLLFVGLWTFFEKDNQSIPETKPIEAVVINNEPLKMDNEVNKNPSKKSAVKKLFKTHTNSKHTSNIPPAIIANKEPVVTEKLPLTEKKEVYPVYDIKKEVFIAARSNVEIKVDPQRLLESAEVERKINKAMPEEKSIRKDIILWKLIKEKHNNFIGNFANTIEIE